MDMVCWYNGWRQAGVWLNARLTICWERKQLDREDDDLLHWDESRHYISHDMKGKKEIIIINMHNTGTCISTLHLYMCHGHSQISHVLYRPKMQRKHASDDGNKEGADNSYYGVRMGVSCLRIISGNRKIGKRSWSILSKNTPTHSIKNVTHHKQFWVCISLYRITMCIILSAKYVISSLAVDNVSCIRPALIWRKWKWRINRQHSRKLLMVFRRVRKIAKGDYQLCHFRPSVRTNMEQLGSHWTDLD